MIILYALDVEELQQRVLDNLVPDILLGIALLLLSAYGLYRLARGWKVSLLPLAVLLPSALGAGLILYVPLSPFYVRSDGEFYQRWGFSLAEAWTTGEPAEFSRALWPGKGLWPMIIGGLTAIAGPVTLTLIVFNTLVLVLGVIVLQKATSMLGAVSARWSVVIVFLSSTPFILWGPSLLREALFWLGVAFGVLALSYASVHRYRSASLVLALSAIVLLGIRPDAGLVFLYGFLAMLIFLFGARSRQVSRFGTAPTSIALLVLASSFPMTLNFVGGEEVSGPEIVSSNVSLASDRVTTAFGAFTEPPEPSEPSEPSEPVCSSEFVMISAATAALCAASVNLPYALFGPFHWEYGPEAIWWLAGASTLHFLVLVALATYYLIISKGRRLAPLALLAVATVSILMFASILTNYGVLIRFRAATEIVLIPLSLSGALALVSKAKSWGRSRHSFLPPEGT